MTETIGSVRLHLDHYPGEDLYSDGEIEQEMLKIAEEYSPEEFDRVAAERNSWPILYHFSSVRTNILRWYPFKKTDKVLEIGSGCGALTGAVADQVKSVTCVELSKQRSLINANRNKEKENIDIILGNFQEVEPELDRDFDIITLIGVFEYGSSYIQSETPYHDFLKIVLQHLRPGGHLIMAIENRLGMKYFAGCTEDHVGTYFEGIENYPVTNYAHTFSKPELETLFREVGVQDCTFYYPYPDYKLPKTIYSDGHLPKKGELIQNMENFDRRRLYLFDEGKAFDSLTDTNLFPIFSNSYCIDIVGE